MDLSGRLTGLLERVSSSLGRLDGLSRRLDPDRLLYMYVRKEAVLSSQIEGTQSTLTELLEYENAEAPGVPIEDVREVSRYVSALRFALDQVHAGMPLSLRLIRDVHRVLMTGGRGGNRDPGEFRRSQNWIGGTRPGTARFVPPPPHELMRVLGDLEHFIGHHHVSVARNRRRRVHGTRSSAGYVRSNESRTDRLCGGFELAFWHSATFSNDGAKVIFTDEWGGGMGSRCRATPISRG
ncbi:MAG: hypothetical protein JWM95_2311 [Gemmatimonadetes bacterium]|nr:hypothetical protein [Gemmatimonadota bacterium]